MLQAVEREALIFTEQDTIAAQPERRFLVKCSLDAKQAPFTEIAVKSILFKDFSSFAHFPGSFSAQIVNSKSENIESSFEKRNRENVYPRVAKADRS